MNASLLASLKPGGLLAVIDFPPDGSESADPADRDESGHHGVTSATVVRELGQAGFEVVGDEERIGSDRYLVVVRRPSE
jgi:predicted methyltransferase